GASPPITTVATNGTYSIDAFASASSGPKALKILKSTDPTTGAKTWVYVEARQPIGFDAVLVTTESTVGIATTIPDGVLVHLGTDSSGNSGSLLDMSPAADTSIWDWLVNAPLLVGQSFNDPAAGVTMTTESVTSTGGTVTVRFEVALTVMTDRSSYTPSQAGSISATVRSGGTPVSNASVSFKVTKANGTLTTASATTGTNGTAVYKLRLGRQDPPGLYQASAVATKDGMAMSATTSFTVQ